jgi:hypothetical protein
VFGSLSLAEGWYARSVVTKETDGKEKGLCPRRGQRTISAIKFDAHQLPLGGVVDEILKIVGAIGTLVGIVGGLTALSTYLRGRQRIAIKSVLVSGSDGTRSCEITVTNLGGTDVTLTEIGFVVIYPPSMTALQRTLLSPVYVWRLRKRCHSARRYSDLAFEDGVQTVIPLKPTQLHTRTLEGDYVEGSLQVGEVAWPYATDSAGRESYAAGPMSISAKETD